jgi:hypothetical protein
MSGNEVGISVIVYLPVEKQYGTLTYRKGNPSIVLQDGTILSNTHDVTFQMKNPLPRMKQHDRITLKPKLQRVLGYSESPLHQIEIYPPSSDGWVRHVTDSGKKAIYTLHEISHETRLMLIISSYEGDGIHAMHILNAYEAGLLLLHRDWDVYQELFFKTPEIPNLQSFLDNAPPTWSFLGKLVEGVTIRNLRLCDSMGETMNQLVSHSYPEEIRIQILAFLSWLNQAEIPVEDPLEFLRRYTSVDVFRFLVHGHLECLLDNVEPPQYVRLLALASKGELRLSERPPPESELNNPWHLVKLKLGEIFPDRMKRAVPYAMQLNEANQVHCNLPVSKEEALSSQDSWYSRFALVGQGIMLRGHVYRDILGLKSLVYIGGAHRWPHNHTDFSARLGFDANNPQQIQFMVVPISAVERVTRVLPTIHPIKWETSAVNLDLYDSEKRRWKMNSSLVVKSMERKKTLTQLQREYGGHNNMHQTITHEDAKLLDMVSWGLFLGSLETEVYSKYYDFKDELIGKHLERLKDDGILDLNYTLTMRKLTSLSFTAEGPSNNILSFARALLKHTPSAAVRISDDETRCFSIVRVPDDMTFKLLTTYPSIAEELGISLKALPVSAYISYKNNLYQRLWLSEGLWDDDVSGLLSQSRLSPQDIDS